MAHTLLIRDDDQLRAASAQEVLDRAAALLAQRFRLGTAVLDKPERTRQYLRLQVAALPYEVFGLLLLDTRHRLIRSHIPFRGTIAGASEHPREGARVVLESNVAARCDSEVQPECSRQDADLDRRKCVQLSACSH